MPRSIRESLESQLLSGLVLSGEFFAIAKRDKNPECGHLVARLNERICAVRGIGPMSVRTDPLAVQVAQQPSSYARITSVLHELEVPERPPQRRWCWRCAAVAGWQWFSTYR